MKGWLFTKTHEPLVFTEKANPTPGKGQVVVNIKASGLCLSDVHFLDDESFMSMATGAPCYLGHECAGIVESVGGYATKILVNDYMCVPLPEKISFAQGASATCGGLTAYHSVFTQGGAKPGMKVGIIGIGGVGQYAVGMASAIGCDVYASSRSQKGKNIATALGAKKVASSIAEFTDENLDVIIDLAGARRTLIMAGMMEKDIVIEDANDVESLILKEVCLKGSCGGAAHELKAIFDILCNSDYSPTLETITFEDIDKGIERLRQGKVEGKLVAVQE